MHLTWQGLIQLEPSLKSWQEDAVSFARNGDNPWYPRWLPTYQRFTEAIRNAAIKHDLDIGECHRIAVAALQDAYNVERERLRRRAAKGTAMNARTPGGGVSTHVHH